MPIRGRTSRLLPSCCIQEKKQTTGSSETCNIIMHSSVELVKDSVLTILPALPPSEAIAVAKVLVSDIGVESTADLQFVGQ